MCVRDARAKDGVHDACTLRDGGASGGYDASLQECGQGAGGRWCMSCAVERGIDAYGDREI